MLLGREGEEGGTSGLAEGNEKEIRRNEREPG